jgi:hypothetical protein
MSGSTRFRPCESSSWRLSQLTSGGSASAPSKGESPPGAGGGELLVQDVEAIGPGGRLDEVIQHPAAGLAQHLIEGEHRVTQVGYVATEQRLRARGSELDLNTELMTSHTGHAPPRLVAHHERTERTRRAFPCVVAVGVDVDGITEAEDQGHAAMGSLAPGEPRVRPFLVADVLTHQRRCRARPGTLGRLVYAAL